jgi:hypothetical protein
LSGKVAIFKASARKNNKQKMFLIPKEKRENSEFFPKMFIAQTKKRSTTAMQISKKKKCKFVG